MANRDENDKDLVAEQPGLGLSFIGLFLAFFMGLAVRAALSPDRVQAHLYQATSNIHKDLKFSFQQAYVSFSRGSWPDLSVVIEDVKIVSTQSCWLTPMAEIHEIRLPLSLRHLFQGQILIHEIFADEVNLSLRTPYSACKTEVGEGSSQENTRMVSATQTKSAQGITTTSTLPPKPVMGKFENVQRKNPIDTIQISSLKIHYLPVAFTSFHIEDFKAHLKSEEPRWIQVLGRLVLEGDTLMGDYSSHADLQLDSLEGANASLQATVKGAWREGSYNVSAKLDSQSQELSVAADAVHLPLSRIIPLLKKYRYVESEFNGHRAWVSGHLRMQGPLSRAKETPVVLEKLKLEGDLGEVSCNQARIQSFQPLQFQPLDFQIRGLNVKELLVFLNRPHPSPALGELGIFNGTAHFVNPERVALRGDYSGLEFIFSNRGSRETQVLSLVSGELELNKNQWNIQVDRIKPVEGIFEGKVQMKADKDFKDLLIDARITELGLAPRVQTLMTGGGSLGALSGQIRTHLKSAQVADLNGQLKWDQLLIEGLRVSRPKMQIQSVGNEIELRLAAQELEVSPQSLSAQILTPMILKHPNTTAYVFKSPSGVFRTRKFAAFSWQKLEAQSPWGALQSSGQWNETSSISGEIKIRDKKTSEVWSIQGTRAKPEIVLRTQ